MVATFCRNLLAAIDAARGRRFTAPILPFAICDARKGGHVSLPPFALGWGRFKLPHRCDNLSHWYRCRTVRQRCSGRSAGRGPNFGRRWSCFELSKFWTTPARIVLQNAAPPFLSRSIRARMYGFFIFQHRQRLRDLRFFRFSHRCNRLRILPIISAIWPVAQMVSIFPRSLRPLAGPVVGFYSLGVNFPLGGGLWVLRLAWLGSGGSLSILLHVFLLRAVPPRSDAQSSRQGGSISAKRPALPVRLAL